MRRVLRALAIPVLIVVAAGVMSPLGAQAIIRIFGTRSGAPIALTAAADGSLNVTVTGGSIAPAFPILGPSSAGTCAAADYSWTGDTNSGLVRLGADNIAGCAGGATIFDWSPTVFSIYKSALATTSTTGALLVNSTAATGGATVQMSPAFKWRGTAWDTAASQTVDFFAEVLPATAATPTGTWKLGYSLNGAAATYPFTVSSAGLGTFGGLTTTTSGVTVPNSSSVNFGSQGYIGNSANGKFYFEVAAGTGFGVDATTDGIMKVRNTAQNADAAISIAYLQGAGTGVSVANVGANSCGTTAATIAGNQLSGVITVGETAGTQCRVTFSTAAPVARDCTVTDSTTTIASRATAVSTTTHDFLGAFVAGDLVTYVCTVR